MMSVYMNVAVDGFWANERFLVLFISGGFCAAVRFWAG